MGLFEAIGRVWRESEGSSSAFYYDAAHHTIGVDMLRIERVASWGKRPAEVLQRYFTTDECETIASLAGDVRAQTRCIATAFAAKEAFYKAFSQHLERDNFPLISFVRMARNIHVRRLASGMPIIEYNIAGYREATGCRAPRLRASMSISHDGEYVIVTVLLEAQFYSSR